MAYNGKDVWADLKDRLGYLAGRDARAGRPLRLSPLALMFGLGCKTWVFLRLLTTNGMGRHGRDANLLTVPQPYHKGGQQ